MPYTAMPAPAREPAFFIIPACRRFCKYELAELRFSAAVAYRPPFGSEYVHLFPHFYRFFRFSCFFQKRACIFRTGVLYYFPKRIICLREYLHCCFSPDKTDRSRPEPPSDLPRSVFSHFCRDSAGKTLKICAYIERFPQFVILTRRDGFRYNLKYSLY